MAEPGSDRVDVVSGAQEVRCRRVTDRVWAHTFLRQRGQLGGHLGCVALDEGVDTKPRERLAPTIQEDVLRWGSIADQQAEFIGSACPQGAQTVLIPFAPDCDPGLIA